MPGPADAIAKVVERIARDPKTKEAIGKIGKGIIGMIGQGGRKGPM